MTPAAPARTFNLADLYEVVADAAPDRTALVAGEERRTYAELDARANRLAHHLIDRGIRPGDWVGIYSWNRAEWVESMIACYKARAVPININYRYVEAELRYLFDDADLRGLIFEREFSPIVAAIAPDLATLDVLVVLEDGTDPDDGLGGDDAFGLDVVGYEDALAAGSPTRKGFGARSSDDLYVLYTGGTTGMPKGVKWRGEDIFLAAMSGARGDEVLSSPEELAKYAERPGVTTFAVAPLMHGGAQWALWSLLTTAGTVVLWTGRGFDPDAILRIAAAERTVSISVIGDAMARPLVEAYAADPDRYDVSGIYVFANGGAMLSAGVRAQIEEHLPHVRISDGFGASETGFNGTGQGGTPRFVVGPTTTVLDDDLRPVEPGSGVVGRLARTGTIPLGYHKDEEKTAATFVVDADGTRWVLPGDLATIEADGAITIFGRGSQVVNTGGEKVFPEEVEATLKTHPGVFDAVVVGVPDPRFGEHVAALVVWRDDSEPDTDDLAAHARTLVAGYKVPKEIHVLDAVQRTPAGKPDYRWAKARAVELSQAHS
jgi:acyl-CoA synthetase (AMP-forming)/AMP-acid ligase II